MNKDYRKNIDIEYNLLNLPHTVSENSTVKATYTYLADGTKLSAITTNVILIPNIIMQTNGFMYFGSMVYKIEDNNFGLESTSFGGGRINATSNDYEIDYFITDHLGSTRVIVDNAGNIKEQNDYYPFGMRHENSLLMVSSNRWGYNGKEKQIVGGINYLDYLNRLRDDFTGRWFVQDPLQEKGYAWSSYVFCFNNPLGFIDTDGRWGKNIHYGDKEKGTLVWMQEGGRFTPAEAEIIASANHYVDNFFSGKISVPVIGNQSYHFNTNGENEIDSRNEKADYHLEKAIGLKNEANALREEANALRKEGGSRNERKARSNERSASSKEKSALKNLGKGLHPIQDIEAHTERYVRDAKIFGIKLYKYHKKKEKNGDPPADSAQERPVEVEKAKTRSQEYVGKYLNATR